jgi:hypothetical protein
VFVTLWPDPEETSRQLRRSRRSASVELDVDDAVPATAVPQDPGVVAADGKRGTGVHERRPGHDPPASVEQHQWPRLVGCDGRMPSPHYKRCCDDERELKPAGRCHLQIETKGLTRKLMAVSGPAAPRHQR